VLPNPILPHSIAPVGSRVHGRRAEVEEAAEKERREAQKAAKKERQEAQKWAVGGTEGGEEGAAGGTEGGEEGAAGGTEVGGGRHKRRRGRRPASSTTVSHGGRHISPTSPAALPTGGLSGGLVLTHRGRQDPEVNAGGSSLLAGGGGRRPLEAAPGRSSGPVPAPAAVKSCCRRWSSCG
jgi:hypothetical protein